MIPHEPCTLTTADRLREMPPWSLPRLARAAAVLGLVLWLNMTVHGFRLPWTPLTVSDANTGAALRQATFGMAGMVGLALLLVTRSLGPACVRSLPWVLLAGLLILSAGWSEAPTLTVKRAAIFALGLLLVMAIQQTTPDPALLMKRITVYTAGVSAIVSLAQWAALPAPCSSIPTRPGLAGVSSHPNTLGAVMFVGLLVSLGFPRLRRIEMLAVRTMQLAMLVALVLTGSVTAMVVLVAGFGIYAAILARPYLRGVLMLVTVAFVTVILIIGPGTVKSAFFQSVQRDESLSGRDTLWADVWAQAVQRPFFGSGYGGFWHEGRGREITGTWNPRQAHHAYLDVFVDLGAVGVLLVAGLIIGSLYGCLTTRMRDRTRPRRWLDASTLALAFALMAVYGFSQSFLLRLDQFAMMALLGGLLGLHAPARVSRNAGLDDGRQQLQGVSAPIGAA